MYITDVTLCLSLTAKNHWLFFFFLSFLPQTQKGIDLYFKLKLFFYQVTAPSEEEPANVDAATSLLSQL